MFKGIFFRRIMILVVSSMILSAFFTTVIYSVLARYSFESNEREDLIDRTSMISNIATLGMIANGDVNINNLQQYTAPIVDAYVFICAPTGTTLILPSYDEPDGRVYSIAGSFEADKTRRGFRRRHLPGERAYELSREDLTKAVEPYAQVAYAGESVAASGPLGTQRYEYIVTATPYYSDIAKTQIAGSIVLALPLVDLTAATNSLSRSLLLANLFVITVMMIVSFYFSRNITKPINRMKGVAQAMASGDFTVRAECNDRDEIGELGFSFNYMARELSRTVNELLVERNRLKQLIDGLGEGIVAVDARGAVTQVNPALCELFRMPAAVRNASREIAREQIIPIDSLWADFDQCLADNIAIVRTLPYRERVLRISITPLEGDFGQIAGCVGLFRDVTESERLEQTRRDYVANVSHELRTPLTGMRALLEPLADGLVQGEDDRMRYYSLIMAEIRRLSRLIDDLLELSRLQSGTIALQKAPFPLDELLSDVADKYAALAHEKGMTFAYEHADLPDVLSNADRIEQILVILLDNALKFTNDGGTIELTAEELPDRMIVSVINEGDGIDDGDIDHVFERFFKADKAHSGNGTGLGLSIARELLVRMGETIAVKCEGGRTRFSFSVHKAGDVG